MGRARSTARTEDSVTVDRARRKLRRYLRPLTRYEPPDRPTDDRHHHHASLPDRRYAAAGLRFLKTSVPIVQPKFGSLAIRDAEDLDDRFQDLFGWGADHINDIFTSAELYATIMSNPDNLVIGEVFHIQDHTKFGPG